MTRFGVRDQVRVWPRGFRKINADELLSVIGESAIGGFMHDADGRLHRDFAVLWPRVVPGGLIVVDDYETSEIVAVACRSRAPKKLMIKRGLDLLIDSGAFVPETRHEGTIFGRKPETAVRRVFGPEFWSTLERRVKTARQEAIDLATSSASF